MEKPTKVMEFYFSSKGIQLKNSLSRYFLIYLHLFQGSSLHVVQTKRHTTTLIKKSTGYTVVVRNLANYIINSLVVFLDKKSLNFMKCP